MPEVPEPTPPDTKDWTWVLQRPCPDCGFDAASLTPEAIPGRVLDVGGRFSRVLERPRADVRPAPDTWSPVEYGRHIADVMDVMSGRLRLILASDGAGARFPDWDQDAAAIDGEYWRSTPAETAALIAERADAAAAAWAEPEGDQWSWAGVRSNGSQFTAASLGAYFVHDLTHHLADVGEGTEL